MNAHHTFVSILQEDATISGDLKGETVVAQKKVF
jgi:hypothetical protein